MNANVDQAEVGKFEDLAGRWWDPEGEMRPLHDLNPTRLDWISQRMPLEGARVADIGCGGGLLSEALAQAGAEVTAVDMAEASLQVARLHAVESAVSIDYRRTTGEALAEEQPGDFDAVTCMELLEHVPEPARLVDACATLLHPGGNCFFSTLNRTPRAFALGIVGAEYVLGLLPRGTHEYARFIRPSELTDWCRAAGLEVRELAGLGYNPFTRRARVRSDLGVNYLVWAQRVERARTP